MTRSKQAGDKGNLLLLDDSPQFMEHYGIRDIASVLITGGGPGYAISPWQHEYNGPYVPSKNDDWVMPVGMKSTSGDDSGSSGGIDGGGDGGEGRRARPGLGALFEAVPDTGAGSCQGRDHSRRRC